MPPSNLPAWLRSMIYDTANQVWPGYNGLLLEAQVLAESGGKVTAVSPAGAVGLMQLMPATARSLGVDPARLPLPAVNLAAGLRYLKLQFDHFGEIPDGRERISFALAAYNCGRGWLNRALVLARADCGVSRDSQGGAWQRWEVAGPYLEHPSCCRAGGKNPDGRAALLYVARVRAIHDRLQRGNA